MQLQRRSDLASSRGDVPSSLRLRCATAYADNVAELRSLNRHRSSVSKVATGFELAKWFPDRKLEKTTIRNGEIRESV